MPNTMGFRALVRGAHKLALETKGDESTLYVYGAIGDDYFGNGIRAIDFAKKLAEAKGTLHVRINSPGGDVFEGRAMAQAMKEYAGEIVVHVDGVAASAATFLTSSAKHVVMAKGSMLMVHNAWTIAAGNASSLIKQAAVLAKIDGQIAQSYADRAGVDPAVAKAWMDEETWFTEAEALEAGLADAISDEDGSKAMAAWDLSMYAKMPKPEPEIAPEAEPAPEPEDPIHSAHAHAKRAFAVIEKDHR